MNLFANNNNTQPSKPLLSFNTQVPQNPEPTNTLPPQSTNGNNSGQSQPTNPPLTNPASLDLSFIERGQNFIGSSRKPSPIFFKNMCYEMRENRQDFLKKLEEPEIKKIMGISLEYFDKSAEKTKLYENEHLKAENFGFAIKQMGDEYRNFKCEKIDHFWKAVVETMSTISEISEYLICQYLQEYIFDYETYQKFFTVRTFSCGSYVRVPNNSFIEGLYRANFETNEIMVSVESPFFLNIVEFVLKEAYSEHIALLKIIKFIQKNYPKYFIEVIKKSSCDYFVVLWKKFNQFSEHAMNKELECNDERSKKLKEFYILSKHREIEREIREGKLFVRSAIGFALFAALDQYGNGKKQPAVSTLIPSIEAINFIDSDLILMIEKGLQSPKSEYRYIKTSLELLIKIIPMHIFYKIDGQRQSNHDYLCSTISKALLETKSPFLESFRFIMWFAKSNKNVAEIEAQWDKVSRTVEQIMRSSLWLEWVALLFNLCENVSEILESQKLLNQSVKMVKFVIANYVNEFWEEHVRAEFYYIREFIQKYVSEIGLKAFLPVLTKCLIGSKDHVSYTLNLIGIERIRKEIRDCLTDSNEGNQKSSNYSMFNSQRHQNLSSNSFLTSPDENINLGFGDYPEQEIKFLCTMVKQCIKDIVIIEEFLFDSGSQSTGILICKLLLECLAKTREYKVSSLKGMRYILSAIDTLFIASHTRSALMVAISVEFTGEKSEFLKTQLYEMLAHACSKPSPSEEYRQSQKLKFIISHHLFNMVKLSRFMSEYFPIRGDYRDEAEFCTANGYILRNNQTLLSEWYQGVSKKLNYIGTPWFSTFLLVLQSDNLLPINFETVRELIIKMQVQKNWISEYECLVYICDILNKASLTNQMLSILEPISISDKDPKTLEDIFLFGLCNNRFFESRSFSINSSNNNWVFFDSDEEMKAKKRHEKEGKNKKKVVIGNLAGCLELIGVLLKIKNSMESDEGEGLELINSLKVFVEIINLTTNKNELHHFQLSLPIEIFNEQKKEFLIESDSSDPTIPINIIQVLASYVNFEKRYEVKEEIYANKDYVEFEIEIGYFIQKERGAAIYEELDDFKFNSGGTIDSNEILCSTDYSIGVGCTVKILQQLLLLEGGSSLLYNCLSSTTYSPEFPITYFNSVSYRSLISEILSLLEQQQKPEKLTILFEFLAIGVNQSMYFLQEMIQGGNLTRLRRSLRLIMDNQNVNAKHLGVIMMIGVFCLALTEHRGLYEEEIEKFIKLPVSLIGEILGKLATTFKPYHRVMGDYDVYCAFGFFDLEKRMGLSLMYKGTVYVCIELLKRFYLYESVEQNAEFLQRLLSISKEFLERSPAPNFPTMPSSFSVASKHAYNENPCTHILLLSTSNSELYYKYKSLCSFVHLLPCINIQYGNNFSYNSYEMLSNYLHNSIYEKSKVVKIMYKFGMANYLASLSHLHYEMMGGLCGLMGAVLGMGEFGYMGSLAEEDLKLKGRSKRDMDQTLMQVKDVYKYRSKHKISNTAIWGRSPEESSSAQLSLLRTLLEYFEIDHIRHSTNDLILNTCSMLLRNLPLYLYQASMSQKLVNILSYTTAILQTPAQVSAKVHSLLLYSIMHCYSKIAGLCGEDIEKLCLMIEGLLCFGGRYSDPEGNLWNIGIYNESSLEINIFVFCNGLGELIRALGEETDGCHPAKTHSREIILHLCNHIVTTYLKDWQNLDIKNIAIINLTNTLLSLQSTSYSTQMPTVISLLSKYTSFLLKALEQAKDSLFNCFLFESLATVHVYAESYDTECYSSIMEFINQHLSTARAVKGDIENMATGNSSDTEKKSKSKEKDDGNQYYFIQDVLVGSSNKSRNQTSLTAIVEVSQLLGLLASICSREINWENKKNLIIVESIFGVLVDQEFIYHFTEGKQGGGRVLRCKISPQSSCEENLEKIEVDEVSNLMNNLRTESTKSAQENKKVNLFEFCIHTQFCHSIEYFIACLEACLPRSQNLRNLYSKILSNGTTMDELVWDKICVALVTIIDYLSDVIINFVKFYPRCLAKLLTMYSFMRENTDFSYDMDFLNMCMGDLNLYPSAHVTPSEQFQDFITGIILSLSTCSIKFVELWKSNDWKSNTSWQESRTKLMAQLGKLIRKCEGHTCTNRESREQIEKIKEWIDLGEPNV